MLNVVNLIKINKIAINQKIKYSFFFLLGLLLGAIASSYFVTPQVIEKKVFFAESKIKSQNLKKEEIPNKNPVVKEEKAFQNIKIDTSKTNQIDTISYNEYDSAQYLYDTILTQSDSQFISMSSNNNLKDTTSVIFSMNDSINKGEVSNKPLEIKKEELIAKIKLPIVNMVQAKAATKADSSIANLADIKQNNSQRDFLDVEFWDSPINYSGYKFSNKKLVLYGLDYFENQGKLYQTEKGLVFDYLKKYYPISETLEYKRYQVLTDTLLIRKIKNL